MTNGQTDRQTDERTDICTSRVAVATENASKKYELQMLILKNICHKCKSNVSQKFESPMLVRNVSYKCNVINVSHKC